ncbi:hypothetical protein JZ751_024295 [Albula glossodonta]|uniref:Uncharacterized protein n=1 Tax=Albula glossodonta TaxID=121402 RepID=A0A8T2NEX3_9TELE|nr:hypothetical protein JZ751_024295 [Albula glossodonta]
MEGNCAAGLKFIFLPPEAELISVRVTTMDAELEFAIQPNTTGKQLFDQACTATQCIQCNV